MPGMYEVYSQQRPGRPRWALGSSAILLLLTVGLAAALIHHKADLGGVSLKPFATSFLRGRLPANWGEIQGDVPSGTFVALAEPAKGEQAGRRLFVFARPAFPFPAPALSYAKAAAEVYAKDILSLIAATSSELKIETPPGALSDRIGSLPAVTAVVRLSPSQDGPVWVCMARASILPGGQVIGVALLTQGDLGVADTRLLEQVSRGLEFRVPGPQPSGVPGASEEPHGVEARLESGFGGRARPKLRQRAYALSDPIYIVPE